MERLLDGDFYEIKQMSLYKTMSRFRVKRRSTPSPAHNKENEMIDINELRRLAQAATPGPWEVYGLDQHGQAIIKGEHIEIATCWHHCVESIEKEMHANAALIAAANPAAIIELLDRLEAAEGERDALRALVDILRSEISELRAKVAQVKKQEPVAKVHVHQTGGNAGIAWSAQPLNSFDSLPPLRDGDKLYTLPGAQPAPKVE